MSARAALLALAFLVGGAACTSARPKPATTVTEPTQKPTKKPARKKTKKRVAHAEPPAGRATGEVLRGRAVWYGADWHGKPTASGETFNRYKYTAAHRTLPLGTRVRVTNVKNGKSVVVRINDRGPYGKDKRRIIDLSEAAAKKLDFIDAGWAEVTIEVLEGP